MSKRNPESTSYLRIFGWFLPSALFLLYLSVPFDTFALCSVAIGVASFLLWRHSASNQRDAKRQPVYVRKDHPGQQSRRIDRGRHQ